MKIFHSPFFCQVIRDLPSYKCINHVLTVIIYRYKDHEAIILSVFHFVSWLSAILHLVGLMALSETVWWKSSIQRKRVFMFWPMTCSRWGLGRAWTSVGPTHECLEASKSVREFVCEYPSATLHESLCHLSLLLSPPGFFMHSTSEKSHYLKTLFQNKKFIFRSSSNS